MRKILLFSIIALMFFSGCHVGAKVIPPTQTPTMAPPTATPQPTNTPTNTPAPEPATALSATVYDRDPYISIMTYHQFAANYAKHSTGLKVRFEDFETQLNQLYDAGFSLVSLEDWLNGNIVVPEGRRPLVLTMDDLYYNNQLRLGDDGMPLPDTGFGVLWNFYQQHPDFGFSCALFINLGDKLYADPSQGNWEMQLAQAIVWGIDHDLMPYNHFYTHPELNKTEPGDILWEEETNDTFLRQLITMAGREDLIPKLDNILALTFGVWPVGNGVNVMESYKNPEGKPVRAIMEIDPIEVVGNQAPPYSPDFDPMHVHRVIASPDGINYLVAHAEDYPRAQACVLGMVPDRLLQDREGLGQYVLQVSQANGCPDGVYIVNGWDYRITQGVVESLVVSP